jgi:hypothetical protein
MTTPTVTEIAHPLEPTDHDGFIDDLAPRQVLIARPSTRAASGAVAARPTARKAPQ